MTRCITADHDSSGPLDAPARQADDGGRIGDRIAAARQGAGEHLGQLLELYRNYLHVLATARLDARLRRRLSPSDLVQETMVGAFRDFPQFRGETEGELLAWLRQILIHRLHRAYEQHLQAACRDLRREVSLDEMHAALSRSALALAPQVADRGPSPSTPLLQQERAVAIANQLAELPKDYREVIVLRNLHGLSFDEIAARMHRKSGAVRMLWLRAMERFRQLHEAAE